LATFSACHGGTCERRGGAATPIAIAREDALYVTNNGAQSLTVVDRKTPGRTVTVPLQRRESEEVPHHIALDLANGHAFVALILPEATTLAAATANRHKQHGKASSRGHLLRLDLATLAPLEEAEVDDNPGDLVLAPRSGATRVLVTHFDMRRALDAAQAGKPPAALFASLQVWQGHPLKKLAERPLCVAPHGIAVTRDGGLAYVACYGSDELAVVDLKDTALGTERIPVGGAPGVLGAPRYGPYSATLSPSERWVLVADLEGQDLRVFDVGQRGFDPKRSMLVGARAMMPVFLDEEHAVVPLQGPDGFIRVNLASATIELTAPRAAGCDRPHAMWRSASGALYAVCEGLPGKPGSVIELDPVTLAVKATWPAGLVADGIAGVP
jgi:hypothetical protein